MRVKYHDFQCIYGQEQNKLKSKLFGKVEQTKYQGLTSDQLIAMARNTVQ